MRQLIWGRAFARALKKLRRRDPRVEEHIAEALDRLVHDPFDPKLDAHKLKGKLAGVWACRAGYDLRILFDFRPNQHGEDDILLFDVGTHDEVYGDD